MGKIDLNNTALVRVYNNFIPLNKRLEPSCNEKFVTTSNDSNYYSIIKKSVLSDYKTKTGKDLNPWNEDDKKIIDNLISGYLPVSSSYTSTLSFSLNGIVPDDPNNKFSSYDIAVIEPLKNHINDNFVNFNVNDTTIKGGVNLSNDAILLINNSKFNSLNPNTQNELKNSFKLELFEGDLKTAVESTLVKYGYPCVELSQSLSEQCVKDGEYKNDILDFANRFADAMNLSKIRLFNLYTNPMLTDPNDLKAQQKISDEYQNINLINEYYKYKFYDYLVSVATSQGMNINEEDLFYLKSEYEKSEEVLKDVVSFIINNNGLERFKQVIQNFNQDILNNYKTNEQIINDLQTKNNYIK